MSLRQLFARLWRDESGAVLTAEAVMVGSVVVVGAGVGLSAMAHSINEELSEAAMAVRSLDQSYCYEGVRSAHAWTAGSKFVQRDVRLSRKELRILIERQRRELRERMERHHHERERERDRRKRGKRERDDRD